MIFPLREYVQTKSEGIEDSLVKEIVATLENMEDVTLKLLMEIVADMAEVAEEYERSFLSYKQSNKCQSCVFAPFLSHRGTFRITLRPRTRDSS